jgi:HlyD family secretion protein
MKEPTDSKRRRRGGSNGSTLDPVASAAELKPGETRKETEGVFVVRDKSKNVEFVPIKLGIAGDKYFEILSGLKPGDQVVTGPYNSVRNIADGDPVKVDKNKQNSSSNR